MAKGKRPPTTSGSPLAAALTARSLRECESLAGPALNSTPLSAGPCGVTFRSRSVPPSVEAVTSSSQLGGVLSPGDVVAFISLGGETETACATMNGVLPSLPPPTSPFRLRGFPSTLAHMLHAHAACAHAYTVLPQAKTSPPPCGRTRRAATESSTGSRAGACLLPLAALCQLWSMPPSKSRMAPLTHRRRVAELLASVAEHEVRDSERCSHASRFAPSCTPPLPPRGQPRTVFRRLW